METYLIKLEPSMILRWVWLASATAKTGFWMSGLYPLWDVFSPTWSLDECERLVGSQVDCRVGCRVDCRMGNRIEWSNRMDSRIEWVVEWVEWVAGQSGESVDTRRSSGGCVIDCWQRSVERAEHRVQWVRSRGFRRMRIAEIWEDDEFDRANGEGRERGEN